MRMQDMIRLLQLVYLGYIQGYVIGKEVGGTFEKGARDVSGKSQTPC